MPIKCSNFSSLSLHSLNTPHFHSSSPAHTCTVHSSTPHLTETCHGTYFGRWLASQILPPSHVPLRPSVHLPTTYLPPTSLSSLLTLRPLPHHLLDTHSRLVTPPHPHQHSGSGHGVVQGCRAARASCSGTRHSRLPRRPAPAKRYRLPPLRYST